MNWSYSKASLRVAAIVSKPSFARPPLATASTSLKCFTEMPEAGPTAPVYLEMDFERRQIANLEELRTNPTTRALANAVAAECGQEEWNQLRRIYWGLKRYWTEHSDLEQVEVSFPPDAPTGAMVAYFDIFPFAKRIEFIHEQENWMVDDQYCCNPKCPCLEAVLLFFRLPEKMGQGPSGRHWRSLTDIQRAKPLGSSQKVTLGTPNRLCWNR